MQTSKDVAITPFVDMYAAVPSLPTTHQYTRPLYCAYRVPTRAVFNVRWPSPLTFWPIQHWAVENHMQRSRVKHSRLTLLENKIIFK